MRAERCPVCYGTGKYTDPPDAMNTVLPMPRTCHGCAGKGWIEVGEDHENSKPWTPPLGKLTPPPFPK